MAALRESDSARAAPGEILDDVIHANKDDYVDEEDLDGCSDHVCRLATRPIKSNSSSKRLTACRRGVVT